MRGLPRGRLMREDGGAAVPHVWLADRWWARLRGLLARPPLAPDGSEALMIVPCAHVHTLGMAYPLDLLFIDRDHRVCGWAEHLAPGRSRRCRGARATIELHGGTLERLAPVLGEHWRWEAA